MQEGSIIKCIADHDLSRDCYEYLVNAGYQFPEKGKFYTVRETNNDDGVLLKEIKNPLLYHLTLKKDIEVAFHKAYFQAIEGLSILQGPPIDKNFKFKQI